MSEARFSENRPSPKRRTICVVGLGYVGLPLAYEFSRTSYNVIGYDINPEKIDRLASGFDVTGDVGDEAIEECDITFTDDPSAISQAGFVLITVPTPVTELKIPDLTYVEQAGETVGRHVEPETIIVLESTVYPGATREILIPAIERTSNLTVGEDVFVGYSPERVVPGDTEHGIRDVMRIVSGQTDDVLEEVAALYETIVDAGVHRASEIEIAEAAKCVENIQRDINIALVNELAIACEHLELDTRAVLEAAETKWNFHKYRPGLVGGHCIPIDPFFIITEAQRHGFTPKLIQQARAVNEYVPKHVAELSFRCMNECEKVPRSSTVLVFGLSYKPGVADIRTSAVSGTIHHLESYGVDVIGFDPYVDRHVAEAELEIEIQETLSFDEIDGMILATPHDMIHSIDLRQVASDMAVNPFIVDVDRVLDERDVTNLGFNYRTL
ncbi:nucleotide sugar dehydrogenase [Halobacteria archaeon AArc-m2/3/4]|uniref:UDP-N-acetyl-D-mannosamine dehydrogenase n=1 Tax=Natronoglomus mannanivorans TaxID=2979990 RepID=A0ABT2QKB0_9EURY|nr:nucleotide sugar dehydrogenase [Halobacteria archaeon AArc-m2/3/4]